MNPTNPSHSTVKHVPLNPHKVAAGVAAVNNVVNAGNQSAAVQGSPVAKATLGALQAAAGNTQVALTAKLAVVQEHQTATKTLNLSFSNLGDSLRSYEASINVLANGDGAVINGAGLLPAPRSRPPPPSARCRCCTPSSASCRARPSSAGPRSIARPASQSRSTRRPRPRQGRGRRSTPAAAAAASSRRPRPERQLLARVAAVQSDGTQSPWCTPILVTAR